MPNPKVELIHVSRDSDEESAKKWAKKEQFPWPTVLPDKFDHCGLAEFAGNGVPNYVLVDKDGKLLAQGLGQVMAKVEELTGKGAGK